jgi:alanine dehydrogenase
MNRFVILNKKEVNQLISIKDARLLMGKIIKLKKESTILSHPPRMVLNLNNDRHDVYQFRAGYLKEIEKIGLRIANLKNNETRHVLLIDEKSSQPLALINESETFKLRVSGTVANIIKYLSKKDSSVVGLIGAGNVARTICLGTDELRTIDELRVFDKYNEAKNNFIKELRGKTRLRIIPSSSIQEAIKNADIIITVTTANEALVKFKWVKKGCLVISLGMGQELDPQLVLKSDKIIVDDIELCKSIGDIAYLMNHGLLKAHQIYGNLYEIFGGIKQGRESNSEIIVVVSQGMIAGDIALIHFVYEKALKKGIGRIIKI